MIKFRCRHLIVLALVSLIAATGCAPQRDADRLTVYAASSLAEVITELAQTYEASQPGAVVDVSLAGSQVLRLQIERGARADVFISANVEHVHALQSAGFVEVSQTVASNDLVIIVPTGNPGGLRDLRDLATARRVIVADPAVPAGQYTEELLHRAGQSFGAAFLTGVTAAVVSREISVRLVRAKVELGEADAAIVYRTDARATARVDTLEIPPELNVHARYVAAAIRDGAASDRGVDFVRFLGSPAAHVVFARHGFGPGGES